MTDTNRAGTEALKSLSWRWFEEVWNQGRAETIDELLAADCAIHGPGDAGPALRGPAKFHLFAGPFRAALADIHVEVDDVLAEGDRTAVRFTVTATHAGPELGVEPTGRPVRFTGTTMIRWRDGQIVEGWNESDAAGLYRQIGLPPAGLVAPAGTGRMSCSPHAG